MDLSCHRTYFTVHSGAILIRNTIITIGSLKIMTWHVQAPDAMRSLASALQLLTTALGSYVATAVTLIIKSVSCGPNLV